jgi:urease accessory protein
MNAYTTLLLLADGRFPAGGHAHSGGLEPAITAGRVRDVDTLAAFLRGRLHTAGLVSAAFAAKACATGDIQHLDAELDARTPSPALRKASRAQGRALLRAGRAMWTLPTVDRDTHHPVALGVVAAAAGLTSAQAASTAVYGAVTGPASAAVRLLGLDPYAVHALLADLAAECDAVADRASTMEELPACSAPLLDIGAEVHASWEVRLFAS